MKKPTSCTGQLLRLLVKSVVTHVSKISREKNKCIGDDTKSAARRSPNCTRKKIRRRMTFSSAAGILPFAILPDRSNLRAIPNQVSKFRPNRATRGGATSYTISRWRQRWLNTTSGFVYNDVTFIRRSKSIRKPNFVDAS